MEIGTLRGMTAWNLGDRVIVPVLPDGEKYTYRRDNPGTVIAIDPQGVTVELDEPFNGGARFAYTTFSELRPA